MGVDFFSLGGILEPINEIFPSLCPLNHFKLTFQTKFMQIKNTHLLELYYELADKADLEIVLTL